MDRVFTELTPECEITARMYAQGYEKKEIANLKCRAVSTINNQLQRAFDVLQVRNGRELATMLYERIAGVKFTMDFSPINDDRHESAAFALRFDRRLRPGGV